MNGDSVPANESLRAVRRALRKEQWATAEELVERSLAEGLSLAPFCRAFRAADKSEILTRVVWDHRAVLFTDVGTVALFAKLAADTARAGEYFSMLRSWALGRITSCSTFAHTDSLISYRNFDERALAALFLVKYGAWDLESSDDALLKADRFADCFQIEAKTAGFFHNHSCDHDMDFAAWLHKFKAAQVLHHLFSDASAVRRFQRDNDALLREKATNFCRMARLEEYLQVEEAKRVFEEFDLSRGLLLSTFHGGFLKVSNFFYTNFLPDPYWLTLTDGEEPNVIGVPGNERAAAFRAFKALSEGRVVLIAPDGPHYGESAGATIEVLGLKTRISEGSALLAYESNCDTGWLTAFRQGSKFVPEFVSGPRRLQRETYKAFRDRWLSFYVERLQRSLSSGPENLVLIARWASPYSKQWN